MSCQRWDVGMPLCMLSKAFLKCAAFRFLSFTSCISLLRAKMGAGVDLSGASPFWFGRRCGSTFRWIRFRIIPLMTLVTIDDNVTHRWILGKLRSPFLEIGIISLSLSCVDFWLSVRMLLTNVRPISLVLHRFSNSETIPSGPVVLIFYLFSNILIHIIVKWICLNVHFSFIQDGS